MIYPPLIDSSFDFYLLLALLAPSSSNGLYHRRIKWPPKLGPYQRGFYHLLSFIEYIEEDSKKEEEGKDRSVTSVG